MTLRVVREKLAIASLKNNTMRQKTAICSLLLCVFVLAGCAKDSLPPLVPTSEIHAYTWKEIRVFVTPTLAVTEDMGYTFYFNDVRAFDAKVPLKHPTSIFRDFALYKTEEGVLIAVKSWLAEGPQFCKSEQVEIIGMLKEDMMNSQNKVFFVSHIEKHQQACLVQ